MATVILIASVACLAVALWVGAGELSAAHARMHEPRRRALLGPASSRRGRAA